MLPAARLTVPLTGLPTLVTLKVSPSTSESLLSSELAAITSGVSSAVVAASLTATGASLTGLTVALALAGAGGRAVGERGVGERGWVVVVGVRRESDVAGGEAHRAVDRAADAGDAQGVAVDVGVVAEQRAGRDHQRRVLGGGGRVVDRDRGVVDGADGDVDRG